MTRSFLWPLCALALLGPARGQASAVNLQVDAGVHRRVETVVVYALPESARGAAAYHLQRRDTEAKPTPAQLVAGEPPAIAFRLEGEMAPGETRHYRLVPEALESARPIVACEDDGRRLTLNGNQGGILRYNYALVLPPKGIDGVFARSGYLHPIWTPRGHAVTGDFPKGHPHQHGIWFAHPKASFRGHKVDFWNSKLRKGKIEFERLESKGGGPVFGWFRSHHRHVDTTSKKKDRVALHETWDVRVYPLPRGHLVDLDVTHACAGKAPLSVSRNLYGGFGFRGPEEWSGKDAVGFVTSEGKGRKAGNKSRARWCAFFGDLYDEPVAVTLMGHPENVYAPQPIRIHPDEAFLSFAPCQKTQIAIRPAKPYRLRYRLFVQDGAHDAAVSERLWQDYADPPGITLK